MNKQEIINFCLTLPNTFEDRPFQDDYETVAMKHIDNKKWYALIMRVKDKIISDEADVSFVEDIIPVSKCIKVD